MNVSILIPIKPLLFNETTENNQALITVNLGECLNSSHSPQNVKAYHKGH